MRKKTPDADSFLIQLETKRVMFFVKNDFLKDFN